MHKIMYVTLVHPPAIVAFRTPAIVSAVIQENFSKVTNVKANVIQASFRRSSTALVCAQIATAHA